MILLQWLCNDCQSRHLTQSQTKPQRVWPSCVKHALQHSIQLKQIFPPDCGFLPLEYTSHTLSLILSCALPSTLLSITLSSQCSYSCLFPLQFSSHPFTENVHPPLTRTHSFTWLLNKNLFKNKYTRIRTHLLVMPRGPQLLAVVLKTHAAREKGQRSMLAVDSYYSPILSFSQDQWVRWLSENKKREKDRLRKRESERETPTILI